MPQILEFFSILGLTFFAAFYSVYLLICLISVRKPSQQATHVGEWPSVAIIIPTYNEAAMMPKKVKNLQSLQYPKNKLEVIFVDGGSTDETVQRLKDCAKDSDLAIRIIEQHSRNGFNNAVMEGFSASLGEVICITGAETEYDSRALKFMVSHFVDPDIGAVTGRLELENSAGGFSSKLEKAYRGMYDLVRLAESKIDSVFDIKGEITTARRTVISNLVRKKGLQERGAIDACVSFEARREGLKAVYEPKAIYFERAPGSLSDSVRQQTRRAAALIENMLLFREMFLKRRFGAFGLLIMPAHFLMLIVLPLLLLGSLVAILVSIILGSISLLFLLAITILLAGSILCTSCQAFFKTQFALILALMGLLIGIDTQKFARIISTRS